MYRHTRHKPREQYSRCRLNALAPRLREGLQVGNRVAFVPVVTIQWPGAAHRIDVRARAPCATAVHKSSSQRENSVGCAVLGLPVAAPNIAYAPVDFDRQASVVVDIPPTHTKLWACLFVTWEAALTLNGAAAIGIHLVR